MIIKVINYKKNMDLLNSYFSNLVFSRIEEKEGFVMYGACIATGLGGGKRRYILLFVPNYLAVKNKSRIGNLKWQNLQSREITHSYDLPMQQWSIKRDAKDILLEVEKREKDSSSYKVSTDNQIDIDFPFEILLLHDPKKKTKFQYRNRLTLTGAIELFNCVFNYTGNQHEIGNNQIGNNQIGNNQIGNKWANPLVMRSWADNKNNIDDSFELIH
jgi:hypothetical protein